MSTPTRAAIVKKAHAALKRHYRPASPVPGRSVLEHLLYACCLENARYELADEAFARLQQSYFDWNEVRVTTVRELAEVFQKLPRPTDAAIALKQTLHSIFESIYDFDLESLRKESISAAVKRLESYRGTNSFTIAYVVQQALGGHAIPLCQGSWEALRIIGAASDSEPQKKAVAGLERAIPKSKGIEFASLLHQLGADLIASPYHPRIRSILLEINPDAKARLPKRAPRKAQSETVQSPGDNQDQPQTPEAEATADETKPAAPAAVAPAVDDAAAPHTDPKQEAQPEPTGPEKPRKPITRKASPISKKSATQRLARKKPR